MIVRRQAGAAVRDYVSGYWGYAERTGRPTRQREPLATSIVLIFGLGTHIDVAGGRFGTFVAGLDDRCTEIGHDGEMRGIQVDLSPLGARMIFGVPMHELAREVVPLEDVLGRDARRLDEQLEGTETWDARFVLVERALATWLNRAPPPPADVAWAWQRLRATHGVARVSELAAALGCSRKHLAARFRDHVGLPPKLVGRTMRFRRAIDLLETPSSFDEITFACGYYDQSHLIRDFQDFAGTTPTAYRESPRAPVTFVQDA